MTLVRNSMAILFKVEAQSSVQGAIAASSGTLLGVVVTSESNKDK